MGDERDRRDEPALPPSVLHAYEGVAEAAVRRLGHGLINETFLLSAGAERFVLQRVNPIFPPAIHENIAAVTERLASRGVLTPRLVPSRTGALFVTDEGGLVYRLMTFVDGVSFDVVGSPEQARSAGALVGRFHAALEGLAHAFVGLRSGVHDTARHLERLREALEAAGAHRLRGEVAPLGEEILARAAALPPLPPGIERVGHGDLKFNNLLFAGAGGSAAEQAVCLIDLDTVGPQSLAFELGDAWRSWCNRAGEDSAVSVLDLEPFRASVDGYQSGLGRPLSEDERRSMLLGVEWVSLELAARFGADALLESYFGWDPRRFPGRGEHNLLRARGQLSLHRALAASREARARILGLA